MITALVIIISIIALFIGYREYYFHGLSYSELLEKQRQYSRAINRMSLRQRQSNLGKSMIKLHLRITKRIHALQKNL